MRPNPAILEIYLSAKDDFFVFRSKTPDILELSGLSSLDLLHRISTNELLSLTPYQIRQTVLTTPLARIVDVVSVLHLPDRVNLLTSPGYGHRVQEWLLKHIFFNDDVQVEKSANPISYFRVFGPSAENWLAAITDLSPPLLPNEVAEVSGSLIWRTEPPLPGFHLLTPKNGVLQQRIESMTDVESDLSEEAYQILRMESGIPEIGKEITEKSIPLEVGLTSLISFKKGCYTGQEIIARMDAREAASKQLVGFVLEGEVPPGAKVLDDQREVGVVTSVACSPKFGWIALGIVSIRKQASSKFPPNLSVDGTLAELVDLPLLTSHNIHSHDHADSSR